MKTYTFAPHEGLDFSPLLCGALDQDDVRVLLSSGIYDLYEGISLRLMISNTDSAAYPFKQAALVVRGHRNVTLEGKDAVLRVHGRQMAFALLDCQDVTLCGVRIEYVCPTVIDCRVLSSDSRCVRVHFPSAYRLHLEDGHVCYTGADGFAGRDGMMLTQHMRKEGHTQRTREDLFFHAQEIKLESPRILRILYDIPRDIAVGDTFSMRDTMRDTCGAHIAGCQHITISDVHVGFCPQMGWVIQLSRALTFNSVCFAPALAGQISSSGADCLHFSCCGGFIRIQNCTFFAPHDDAINIHGIFMPLHLTRKGQCTLRFAHPQTLGFSPFAPGDALQWYAADALRPLAPPCRVLESTLEDDLHLTLRLDAAVPIKPGVFPVAQNMSLQPDVFIEGCLFRSIPTRGVLVSTAGRVHIRGNRFERIHMACIYISGDAGEWYESGPVRDVLIEKNVFSRCEAQAVKIEPNVKRWDGCVHSGISLRGNVFNQWRGEAVWARGVDGLHIDQNMHDYPCDISLCQHVTQAG